MSERSKRAMARPSSYKEFNETGTKEKKSEAQKDRKNRGKHHGGGIILTR